MLTIHMNQKWVRKSTLKFIFLRYFEWNSIANLQQQKCHYKPSLAVVNVTSWAILPRRDELSMKKAIALVGPIPISINARPTTFQLYSHGIYSDPECTSDTVNHAMLAVGYTPEYFILQNWWVSFLVDFFGFLLIQLCDFFSIFRWGDK